MKINVNGEMREITSKTLSGALSELNLVGAKVATAVNEEFVPTPFRQTYELTEGDRLEILAPMQGG